MINRYLQQGLTLLELAVVLLILTALGGLAMPYVMGTGEKAMCQTTDATLQAVKDAIMGGKAGAGFYGDLLGQFPHDKSVPNGYSLQYLISRDDAQDNDGDGHLSLSPNPPYFDGVFDPDDEWQEYNPKTGVGWHGPYLQGGATNQLLVDGRPGDDSTNGTDGADDSSDLTNELHTDFDDLTKVHVAVSVNDVVVLDGWGRPIILQVPTDANCGALSTRHGGCARLVSAGPIPGRNVQSNGIDTDISDARASSRGDDRVLFLQIPDPLAGGNTPCN